jgi:nitroreductase
MHNSVLELLRDRHATRSIDPLPLTREVIDDLVEAARLTPSCYNNQPWRFLFLIRPEDREAGVAALTPGNRVWAERAPLLVVGHVRREDDCISGDGRTYYQFDLGLAVMNLMLSATAHGLVARPMAGFEPPEVQRAFGLPDDAEPLVMVAVGWPATDEGHLPEALRGKGQQPRERVDAGAIVEIR